MSTTYQALLAQRTELDKQIEEARIKERNTAIDQCNELLQQLRAVMKENGISNDDLQRPATAKSKPACKVPPKYRDPATGATWTGRGKPPLWIAGKDRSTFQI